MAYRSRSMISCWIFGSKAPLIPLQVVQANPTIPKPSCSSSSSKLASLRYSSATLEPGAKEVFTHGLRSKPNLLALRAIKAAAITLRGLLVFVQLVIAAMITAPSGIKPSSFFHAPAIPLLAKSLVETSACGLEGPAILRPTLDRSKVKTRSYSTSVKASAHKPVTLA